MSYRAAAVAFPSSSFGRELLARLALSAGSIVFFFLIAELVLRAPPFVPERSSGAARVANTKGLEVRAGTLALLCYPSNPRGYFDIDLRDPGTRARYEALGMRNMNRVVPGTPYAIEYRYNSLVFRGGEFGPKQQGRRRVVVIGDSFTEGWGVREADAYPQVMGRLLNSAEPGRWEVLNCGGSNADFPALYNLFKRILALEPDIVIYGMVLNDPEETNRLRARRPNENSLIPARLRMSRGPDPGSRSRLIALLEDRLDSYRIGRETTRWYLDLYGDQNFVGWRETKGYIRSMNERMQERDGQFLIAIWPLLAGLEGRYPFVSIHETIGHFCAKFHIPRHDLLPTFRGRKSASLWVHPADMHPNEVAHGLAAESLVPAVRDLGSQVR